MNNDELRLSAAVETTAGAMRRLRFSLTDDASTLRHVDRRDEKDLDRTTLLVLDAFVQRFQQAIEHMLHRLYPALYRLENYGDRIASTRNLVIWLEGIGIAAARDWAERIEIRNRLVHEYPLDPQDRAAALIAALVHAEGILADHERVLEWIETRKKLEFDGD